ncbi:MAG TPA: quinol:cytochrome C oxidoreductase [Candidatus Eisenbacteria bacterium]|nr:quinol:cytochrome C oxidoreductase [Candidatus Eisenbacteria bacterium]
MTADRDRVELRPEQAMIPPGHPWNRLSVIGAVCALLGAVACAVLGPANPKQFFFSWLVSFLFFLSLAVGALFFVLIQYATQGGWGIVVRRIGETVFATVPVMAALFVPVIFGLHDLFEWSHSDAVAEDALLRWKAPYLNVPFFLIRAAIYFGCWSFIALLYYRRSRGQDATGDPAVSARLRRFAGPAIIVLALTQTFASVDWIMSLTPHWYSTMFGVYFFAGSFVGFIALLSVVAVAMRWAGLLDTVISPEHLHDIGKLLFAFMVFWTYISFCQFFLIWYANLPEETIWYKARMEGSWMTVSLFLMAGHFVAPFFYLMGRSVKRNGATLAAGGAWLLAMHFVDLYWQVMPTLHPEGVRPSALDVAALLAVGGCFVAAAGWLMRRHALVPLRDPRLAESLAFENA